MRAPVSHSKGPLDGYTIIDLTRVLAGPYCTLLLADLGARVIKVEQPGVGDDARHIGPFVEGDSAYFMSVNRNKESIALDLKSADDRQIFESLLQTADVLVENFRPGTMEKLGYVWEALHERLPRLVYTSVSGFGQTGPYSKRPAYDMVVQAMGGIMSLTGQPGALPTRVGVSIGDLAAGLYAAVGTQAALLQRERTGFGDRVDVAMLDCQVALLENAISRMQVDGRVPGPLGSRHPSITPFDVFRARDGWLVIAAGNDAVFRKLCAVLGLHGLIEDPRFLTNHLRCLHHEALKALIERQLNSAPCADWQEVLMSNDIPTGPYNDLAAVCNDPQIQSRQMLIQVQARNGQSLTVAGSPVHVGAHRTPLVRQPPQLDQDRQAILARIGIS
ncbi:CaiB/BaiF CoA transferase family protein [Verminephrobacter eiseniae]|uniref:CaiB/BaiF CoA transferase family protein n=1 Tax=Verminephrobacter eiseniae TaxID=364317 RepID=UPI0010D579DB|nr:CaiB/BaiF CoA-transferase family protein [Verminephrobacter eiseniae]KAB7623742.1 CoA transferase [Verminephrobacter sp. Larva24]MCW5234081.1 CoA transferase [Verminephrobacter eiseniae]MCW5294363.1 CoA transferase [Verminephrobacter eiseniae]MCW8186421.1 CoA transferase [Verminephrobacter eiseniae]MCW8224868.1 CoA transferase [Verminephrobacter eiseniae]